MSYIPNCRTDENYNQDYLDKKDKTFLAGYDFCIEFMESFFHNLGVYEEEFRSNNTDIELSRFIDKHEDVKESLIAAFKDWSEMQRDSLVVSMIESYDDDKYEKLRQKAIAENKQTEKEKEFVCAQLLEAWDND